MSEVIQTITLNSDHHYGHRVPSDRLGHLLLDIQETVRHSIAMAFRGQSVINGRTPAWLKAAGNVRLVGYSGDDETRLDFAAPMLGQAASTLYEQGELSWTDRPLPDDTGFDLVGDVLADISNEYRDSDRFDPWLLQKFQKFKPLLNGDFREMTITSRRHTASDPARLDSRIVALAHSLYNATPPPQAAMIVGTLDVIRMSTQTFGLRMEGGQEVRCVLADSDITQLRPLLAKPAFVSGRAVFRASGTLLRLEAEHVREATGKDHFFAKLPAPVRQKFDLRQVLEEQQHKRGVAAIFGQWPGDETDEQIEQALRELS